LLPLAAEEIIFSISFCLFYNNERFAIIQGLDL